MATETAQCVAAQADTAHSTALRPRNELTQSGTHGRRESGQVRISMVLELRLMRAAAARYRYISSVSCDVHMYTEMDHFGSQTEALLPSRTDRKITERAPKMETVDTETERAKRQSRSSHFSTGKGRWAWAAAETMSGTQSVRRRGGLGPRGSAARTSPGVSGQESAVGCQLHSRHSPKAATEQSPQCRPVPTDELDAARF